MLAIALSACGGSDPNDVEGCRSRFEPPAEARSCELLLVDVGEGVVDVDFASNVVGEWVREAPSSAIAFHPDGNRAMGGDAVVVTSGSRGGFTVESATCFDDGGGSIDVTSRFGAAPECER